MDGDEFGQICSEQLAPMLGAELDAERQPSSTRELKAAFHDPQRIRIKPTRDTTWRMTLFRSESFSRTELRLVRDFLTELNVVAKLGPTTYLPDVLAALPRRVVARHVAPGGQLRAVLGQLDAWSSQSYEGHRISVAVGVDPSVSGSDVGLSAMWEEEFAPVLSNGLDTLIVSSLDGHLEGIAALEAPDAPPSFAPYRLAHIAHWCEGRRVAAVLNQHGETLVFKSGMLRFARRRGVWLHYVHQPILGRMLPPRDPSLRRAVYESCIDVSFGRSGGCVAIARSGSADRVREYVSPDDLLGRGTGTKARTLGKVATAPFQNLDRRVRQELLALDGAIVLDHVGNILTAGAIVTVPAGSTGGGRRAAAIHLSQLGLAIKISADGPVTGFSNGDEVFAI